MNYNIQHIATILQAKCTLKNPEAVIEYLVTDSRRIVLPDTSLFFALKTKIRNGHDFVEELYQRGVKNFVVHTNFPTKKFEAANFIFTEDALQALQALAAYNRRQFNYPVIGITGSNGKTIVKEWLYQLLSPTYNIVRSPRSYNSQIGVPLSVWQMDEAHNLAIFEAGISEKNEMEKLKEVIQPTIGILTNIGAAHDEGFENREQKFSEKMKLFANSEVLIAKHEDIFLTNSFSHSLKLLTWGKSALNYFVVEQIESSSAETFVKIKAGNDAFFFAVPFTDDASVQNAITCFCVLQYLKIPAEVISGRMQMLQPVDMRLQLIHGINNCSVINDSYSFDTTSFSVALDFLLQQKQHSQKTVIISDLPHANSSSYEELIDTLHAKKINRVITIGEQWMKNIEHLKNKIAVTEHYSKTEIFVQHFNAMLFRDEDILLKGARIFSFEKIASLFEKKVHQTSLEINLNSLVHNLKTYQQLVQPGVKLMAMVKAFGYGSGSAEVANILQFHKADYLAVAYADEGVELRKAGITLPVMVMNADEDAFETIVEYQLEPELYSFNIFRSFNSFLSKQGLQQYPVHLKLDTGMHRLGFEERDMDELCILLKNNSLVMVKSVFSHLASSEDANDDAFTNLQAEKFNRCCNSLQKVIKNTFIKHIANSAAAIRKKELQFDMIRLGIGLYGINNTSENKPYLQTVATLKTTIAQLRKVKNGDTIGYNRKGKVNRNSTIATIRIGYADGFSRKLGMGKGKVWIRGKLAPVIGAVCMDMTMIDVTDIPDVVENDEVEIFGKNISVQQVALWAETISYEILTNISQRVKRIYVEE